MVPPNTMTVVPKLADLLEHPERLSALPSEAVADLRGQLARLDSLLLARLVSGGNGPAETGPDRDRLLDAKQAAAKLGTSADYLYRHSPRLPFTVRLGRKVLFSQAGIERYIRQRMGR